MSENNMIEKIKARINSLLAKEDEVTTENIEEELDNIITLNDEDGNEIRFEFLDLIDYKGEEYVVLLPTDEEDDDGQVVILKIEETGEEEESYTSVDDEHTLEVVFNIFKERFKDEFNFVD